MGTAQIVGDEGAKFIRIMTVATRKCCGADDGLNRATRNFCSDKKKSDQYSATKFNELFKENISAKSVRPNQPVFISTGAINNNRHS